MPAPTYYGDTVSAKTPVFNVKYYLAKGDGIHDDTAAIQSAITAAAQNGGVVYLPQGKYLVSAALVISAPVAGGATSVSFEGDGEGASIILFTSTTANVFSSLGYPSGTNLTSCSFRDFSVHGPASPTNGSVFAFPWCDRIAIERVQVLGCFNFFTLGQAGATPTVNEVWFDKLDVRSVAGTALNFLGTGGLVWVSNSLFSAAIGASSYVLNWNNSYYDVLYLRGLDFENFAIGAQFVATSSASPIAGLADAFLEDIIIDGTGAYGITFAASGTQASFARIKCRNLWVTCVSGPGLALGSISGAKLQDVTFHGCNFSGSTSNVQLNGNVGATMANVSFDFCQLYGTTGNVNGIAGANCTNLTLTNSSIGEPYGLGGSGIGISLIGTNPGAIIRANRVANYVTPASLALGADSRVDSNLGINPVGTLGAPTYVAGSPATNAAPYSVRVSVTGATAVAINGTATGGGAGAYTLLPGETITPTGAGSWTWYGL